MERPITLPAQDASARWLGYGTALKPAWEPVVVARKYPEGTIAENALKHGAGGLAIDANRVGVTGGPAGHDYAKTGLLGIGGKAIIEQLAKGRWPANVVLSHSPGCVQHGTRKIKASVAVNRNGVQGGGSVFGEDSKLGRRAPGTPDATYGDEQDNETVEAWDCVEDCPARIMDEQLGDRPGMSSGGRHRADYGGGMFGGIDSTSTARGDHGGASRFFYSAKVSREERDRGLEGTAVPKRSGVGALRDGGRGAAAINDHPTLKPIDLCRYFARMILPPPRADGQPRRILVPYSGAGSEMIGCLLAGWDEVVGIELDPKHAAKARARIVANAKRR